MILGFPSHADEMRILKDKTPVHSEPSTQSKVLGHLPKDKRVHTVSDQNGFSRIRSRSGQTLWVQSSEIEAIHSQESSDIQNDVQSELPLREPVFKRLRLDAGGAGGSVLGQNFFEGFVGLEYFMMERLSWRNAFFYRFARAGTDSFGLDSSVRGNGNLPLGALRLRGIIGAGYRFATPDGSAPFAEAGAYATLRGFDVGVMVKYLAHSLANSATPNVFIYSIVLSGSAGFF